ncbi:MAG TPA: DUF2142 domain-containing protein [Baekduia sp.]
MQVPSPTGKTSTERPPVRKFLEPLRGRVPSALVALLAVSALVGLTWSLVTPALQVPDENSHTAYVQSLGTRFALPGDPHRQMFSAEQMLAASVSGADQAAAQPATKMAWSPLDQKIYDKGAAGLPSTSRSDGGGPNPASSNPPLYYLTAAVAYVISGGSFFSALFAERLVSVLWIMVAVLGTWLLAGECARRNRLVQVGAAGTVALLPMVGFLSGGVGPDSALLATWSLAMWLGVRLIRHGRWWPDAVALGLVTGAACVVKATGYALVPAVLLAAIIAWRRFGGRVPRTVLGAIAGLFAVVGVWYVVAAITHHAAAAQVGEVTTGSSTPFNLRQFVSYVWQFYLPRVPGQDVAIGKPAGGLAVYETWLKGAWGRFGWLEITWAERVYTVATIVTIGFSLLAGMRLIQRRRSVDWAVVAFLALVIVALLGGVHWTDYHQIVGGAQFAQGRYLLPLVPIVGLVVAYTVRLVPVGYRGAATASILGSLVVLQLFSLVEVLERFYA